MKFILIVCIISFAAWTANAYDKEEIIKASLKEFTAYRLHAIKSDTVISENDRHTVEVDVANASANGHVKTCSVELLNEPSPGVPIKVKIDCPQEETILRNIYMNFSTPSSYPYYYYDGNGQKVAFYTDM